MICIGREKEEELTEDRELEVPLLGIKEATRFITPDRNVANTLQ